VFGHVSGAEQSGKEVCVCVLSVYGRKKEKIKESKIVSVESPVRFVKKKECKYSVSQGHNEGHIVPL